MIRFTGLKHHLKGKRQKIKELIHRIAQDHGNKVLQIDYIFVDDSTLLELNKRVLQHDYYTDIISFDYTENKELEGEIYISLERVKENAKTYSEEFHVELCRVLFHGVLHMVGYKDKSKNEKSEMRKMENKYLKKLYI